MKKTYVYIFLIFLLVLVNMPLNTLAAEKEIVSYEEQKLHYVAGIDEITTMDHILYYALHRIGYGISIETASMNYAVQMVDSGEYDGLVGQVPAIAEEYKNLVRVDEPIGKINFVIYALEESNLHVQSWEELSGLKIGSLYKKAYIIKNIPDDVEEYKEYGTVAAMNKALFSGEIDAYISSVSMDIEMPREAGIKKLAVMEEMPTYTYLNKRYADLVPSLEDALRQMKKDGTLAQIVDGSYWDNEQKTILHISSYYAEDVWDKELSESIKAQMAVEGNVLYYNIPLYSNRFDTDYERASNAYAAIRTISLSKPPDVVLVSDNYAFTFAKEYSQVLFYNTPIIYCGVVGTPDLFTDLPSDYYGLEEQLGIRETVDLIGVVFPKTENVFVINDAYETGRYYRYLIKEEMEGEARYNILFNTSFDLEGLCKEIEELPENTVILAGVYGMDISNPNIPRAELMRKISQTASVPVFTLVDIGNGEFGGKIMDPTVTGSTVAKLALQVLSGELEQNNYQQQDRCIEASWSFDERELERFSISKNSLPEDSKYVNQYLELREANPQAFLWLIISIGLLTIFVFGLFIFTIVLDRKNKRILETQKSLHTSEELLEYQERLNKVMENSYEMSQTLLNSLEHMMYVSDIETDEILFANDALMKQYHKVGEESFQNQKCWKFLMNNDHRCDFCAKYELNKYPDKTIVWENVHPELHICLRHTDKYINWIDGKKVLLHIAEDVTYIKEATRELVVAKETAERANSAKSAFLANMSHEIRTPMNAIIGMTNILLKEENSPKLRGHVEDIHLASSLLLELINNILDMSKIEADRLELEHEYFELKEVLNSIYAVVQVRANEKQQKVHFMVEPEVPQFYRGDALRLTQVIMNIIYNAVKFSGANTEISLKVSLEDKTEEQATLKIEVKDQGIGISEETLEHLFEPFEQGDKSISKTYGGSGLGLALSKRIVECMGGNIAVESTLNKGSTFTVTVQFDIEAKEQPAEDFAVGEVSLVGKNILVVEDVEINREIVKAMLESTGAAIDEAENGRLAVELFYANPSKYDLVLMDIQMPELDGYGATAKIREIDKDVAIVAMTAYAFKEDKEHAEEVGMCDHISKPIDAEIFIEKVKKWCRP